jgi:pyruvate dehydrogenase E1 component alpha subunit
MASNKNEEFESGGGVTNGLTEADLLDMLEKMHLLRSFDERVSERCKRGEISGLIHLGMGEEAVAVGVCAAIKPNDKMTSTHRAHGHFLAKGGDPKAFMAELYGKQTGCCRGKGGSMHLFDLDCGFLGANGVVGAGLPIAVGAALGQRILGEDFVTICFFGDGANNQGTFHESLNLATVWNLPVVFVCENNEYGISQSIHAQQKVPHVSDRAASYLLAASIVDGNDVLEVYTASSAAVAAARSGRGPTLLECKTYRTSGHYEGDDQSYRPKEEVDEWKAKDPIRRFERQLLQEGVLTDGTLDEIKARVWKVVEEATEFAIASQCPPDKEATNHVFAASQ